MAKRGTARAWSWSESGDAEKDEANLANLPQKATERTLANVLQHACNWSSRPRNLMETPPLRCSGATELPSTTDQKRPTMAPWGLPTPSCPAPSFLLNEYPRLHRARLAAGNVLVFCSRSGALGNYFRQLPMALAVSVLTQQALLLECDLPMTDRGRAINITRHLRTYFKGPHFDWSAPFSIGADAAEIDMDKDGIFNLTIGPIRGAARLYASGGHTVLRLLRKQAHRRRFGDLMAGNRVFLRKLDGCLLRYLLSPTRTLSGLLRKTPSAPPLTQDGWLHYSAALHLRLGDYYMSDIDDTWIFKRGNKVTVLDVRGGTFFAAPAYLLACLRIAQEDRRRRFGGPAGGGGCKQSVVVSNSELGETCARAALDSPSITLGRPTHLVASRSESDVGKVLLDWWLLARSASLMTIGPDMNPSSFYQTARQFRDATSPDGELYLFSGKALSGALKPCSRKPADELGEGVALLASWNSTVKGKEGCFYCERLCSDYREAWRHDRSVDNGLFPMRARITSLDVGLKQNWSAQQLNCSTYLSCE